MRAGAHTERCACCRNGPEPSRTAVAGAARDYHPAGSGAVPVGCLVFKTSGAALGVVRWVRLPCAPATAAGRGAVLARNRPGGDVPKHPPSVERVLAAARSRTADRDPEAVAVLAREVVAAERRRLE